MKTLAIAGEICKLFNLLLDAYDGVSWIHNRGKARPGQGTDLKAKLTRQHPNIVFLLQTTTYTNMQYAEMLNLSMVDHTIIHMSMFVAFCKIPVRL